MSLNKAVINNKSCQLHYIVISDNGHFSNIIICLMHETCVKFVQQIPRDKNAQLFNFVNQIF